MTRVHTGDVERTDGDPAQATCRCVWGGKCPFLRAELGWRHLLLTPSSFKSQTELLPTSQSAQEGQAGHVLASTSASFHPSGPSGGVGEGV